MRDHPRWCSSAGLGFPRARRSQLPPRGTALPRSRRVPRHGGARSCGRASNAANTCSSRWSEPARQRRSASASATRPPTGRLRRHRRTGCEPGADHPGADARSSTATHADGRAMRVLGQPVWAGRRDVETVESRLHEGLVNLVIPPDAPLWLICPYDASHRRPGGRRARRAQPSRRARTTATTAAAPSYAGAWYVDDLFRRSLPPAPDDAEVRTFVASEIGDVANRVLATAFRGRARGSRGRTGCPRRCASSPPTRPAAAPRCCGCGSTTTP